MIRYQKDDKVSYLEFYNVPNIHTMYQNGGFIIMVGIIEL